MLPHRPTSAESFPADLIRVRDTVSIIFGNWLHSDTYTRELALACHVIRDCLHTACKSSYEVHYTHDNAAARVKLIHVSR